MNYFNRVRENIRRKVSVFSGSQWVIILVFCFAYLFAACVNSLQAPFYPAEAERKGASATEYGLVFGIFQLIVFIASPIFGKYMHFLGAKLVLELGLFTIGASCFAFGFLARVNDHTAFITLSFAIRVFEAIGASAFCTASFTIIAGEFAGSVATTFASLETFYGLGLIIGPTLGGILFELGGFLLPFVVTGLCLIVVALITPCLVPGGGSMDKADSNDQEGFSIITLLRIPAATLAALTIWMSSCSIGFLSATLEPHLRQFHLSEMQVGLVFMTTGISYSLSAPIWGKLMDKKWHPKYVSLFGCGLLIVAHLIIGPAIFIPIEPQLGITCVGLIIHGIGVGAIQVSGFVLALRESIANGFPDSLKTYSVVSGLWASFLSLGMFVGPSLGGWLLDQSSFRMSSLFPLVTAIIVLVLVIGFIIRKFLQPFYLFS
ncbi:MFS-type transporter SLC18B1 isoform X2 [Folsomia candida]|uniref:MFS-type transporter SLC18B1 isoform X2 n=1 Tax=Folsomia candida TaxID=158441 RepID=UPI0016052E2F|nr:MFS-type transporter SLC18B1 isoform X2 [Folsomia candida]